MPYVRNRIKVKVPHNSGFDKSHRNSGTGYCGTLIPVLCDEVIPGSRVNLRYPVAAQLPPLVSDTYMNCKLRIEAFFVPSRLCSVSFEDFFCDFPKRYYGGNAASAQSQSNFFDVKAKLPVFRLVVDDDSPSLTTDLADYLGCYFPAPLEQTDPANILFNPMPFIAYHLIWQEYYRNPRVQNPAFAPSLSTSPYASGLSSSYIASLPYTPFHAAVASVGIVDNHIIDIRYGDNDYLCADGHDFFTCRQRNFGLDYFTGARPSAQQGDAVSVQIPVTGSDAGTMTIAQLRAANSLQQFRERNNIPSPRLVDQVKARYGANLADGVAQRPICIGTASYNIDSTGVSQTSDGDSGANLFSGVAAQYGRAYASGSDFIIDDFTCNEPGYIMLLQSLVPEVSYSTCIDPMFERYTEDGSIVQMACHLLQNIGDQPIYSRELNGNRSGGQFMHIFGFTDRFADFMFKKNSVHGEFKDGKSLSSFVLQRSFPVQDTVTLGSDFLEIPKNYLDGILTVKSSESGLSYWFDSYIQYRVSMPLAEYSIPSLQDPAYEHGETVVLRRNGQIF